MQSYEGWIELAERCGGIPALDLGFGDAKVRGRFLRPVTEGGKARRQASGARAKAS